jgi:hypothetical protein
MRNDLRELAKLATPAAPPATGSFRTADSSGYVDLSAYSARDAAWVDRELARAKRGAPPALPGAPRKIDSAMPLSMAPVAMEAFLAPEATAKVRPSKARRALFTLLGLASVGVVGFLAVQLARHPPPAAASQASVVAAPPHADTAPPATSAAAPRATTPDAPPLATAATSAIASAPAVATTAPTTKKKSAAPSHVHTVAVAAAPPPSAAHAAPAARAAAHSSSGGDSLMDLIKKSVATGK